MASEWIFMLVIWGVVEFIQFLRKKPYPARMRTGACWSATMTALALIGGMSSNQTNSWSVYLVAFSMTGFFAFIIYFVRISIGRLWKKIASQ